MSANERSEFDRYFAERQSLNDRFTHRLQSNRTYHDWLRLAAGFFGTLAAVMILNQVL